MGDLGPLRRAEVLTHVDDAVHGHVWVGLDQAGTHRETQTHKVTSTGFLHLKDTI